MKRSLVLVLCILAGCGSKITQEGSPCFKSGKFQTLTPGLVVSTMGTMGAACAFRPLPTVQ
ncbi:MAG: hypothetical protein ACD_54C01262G0002 [uncultured bacterium]|nr:MAG: hypothetical protein ACD_54C01262G0002 [uncultured bacterium]